VTPTLLEHLEDGEAYRDTRHAAEVALTAIGLQETADVMAAEVRHRLQTAPARDHDEGPGISRMLDALAGLPGSALAASTEVGPMITTIRDLLGGPARYEHPPFELRLVELIEEKIEESGAENVP
jgi:hypothetical protein